MADPVDQMASLKTLNLNIRVLQQLTGTADAPVKDMVETLILTADNIKQEIRSAVMAKKAESPAAASSGASGVVPQQVAALQKEKEDLRQSLYKRIDEMDRALVEKDKSLEEQRQSLGKRIDELERALVEKDKGLEEQRQSLGKRIEELEREKDQLASALEGKTQTIEHLHDKMESKAKDVEREAAARQEEEVRNAQQLAEAKSTIGALTAALGRLERSMPEATVEEQSTMGGGAGGSAFIAAAGGGGGGGGRGDVHVTDSPAGGGLTRARRPPDWFNYENQKQGDAREEDEEEEEEEEEESPGSSQAMDEGGSDDDSVQDVTEAHARKRRKTAVPPPANIPPGQQAVVESLAVDLKHMIPGIGYKNTIEACLHVLFQQTGFMPPTPDMFKWLTEKTRALPEGARDEMMGQFKSKPHYKQNMQRVLDFLLNDSEDNEALNGTVGPGVEGQIYRIARKCGLGMAEEIFRKVLAEGMGEEPLASVEDFKARMQKEETQQRFVKFYETTSDNPKKGVVCRIYDAAGLDGNALLRMNRKKPPGEGGAQRRSEHPSSTGGTAAKAYVAGRCPAVPPMSAVEQQIYDKVKTGLHLPEAVFRKVLADKKLPPSALESLEAFTAHMRKPETQAELFAYNQTCDNQKKGVVARLFTVAGVDASFLKSAVRKRHAGAINLTNLGTAAAAAQAAPVLYGSQWPGVGSVSRMARPMDGHGRFEHPPYSSYALHALPEPTRTEVTPPPPPPAPSSMEKV